MASIDATIPEKEHDSECNLNKPTELGNRLYVFVKYFVCEIEATLTSHYKILFNDSAKSVEFDKVLVEIFGSPVKYFKAPSVESLTKKVPESPFEENKCYDYFEVVYNFNKHKSHGREFFVRIAIEVFQSFELQLMGVDADQSYDEAMKRLGIDAAQRFFNYIKEINCTSPTTSKIFPAKKLEACNVVFGKSTEKIVDKITMKKLKITRRYIPDIWYPKLNKSGFEIMNKNEIWNTANLYEKAGIVVTDDNNETKYYTRKQSKCKKYLFRRPFNGENWSKEYNIQLQSLDFSVDLQYNVDSDYYKEQYTDILCKLNESGDESTEVINKMEEDFVSLNCKNEVQDDKTTEKSDLILDLINNRIKNPPFDEKNIKFGLSNPLELFTGRQEQLESIHKVLTDHKESAVISQAATITGIGGIGKTELALKYAHDHYDHYHNIIFIYCENRESIDKSFRHLATQLWIPTIDETKNFENEILKQAINVNEIVRDIYKYLGDDQKSLIIFDNVEDFRDVKDIIYRGTFASKNISTLITSRNQNNWDIEQVAIIPLCEFTESEAIDFTIKSLGKENESDVKMLTETLNNFPLALKHVTGYIKQQNQNIDKKGMNKFTAKDYLELYAEVKGSLFEKYRYEAYDVYHESIAITSKITLKKIKENTEHGNTTLNIFHILAYLSPDKVHVEDLFFDIATEKLWNAIALLNLYSMVDLDIKRVRVHSMVQKVTRSHLKAAGVEEKVLKETLLLLNGTDFLDSVVTVWEYSSKYSQLVKDFYSASHYGESKSSPLHLFAAYRNDYNVLKDIVSQVKDDLDLNSQNASFESALYVAAKHGNVNIVMFLCQINANLNETIYIAASNGQDKVVEFLGSINETLTSKHIKSDILLDLATIYGHERVIKVLKPDDSLEHSSCARLNNAIMKESDEICLALIKDMHANNPKFLRSQFGYFQMNVLHIAAKKGNVKIVQSLLNCGLDLEISNRHNLTPIHFAAKEGNVQVMQFLLEKGANFKVNSLYGQTLLHYAANACDVDTLKMLIHKGLTCNDFDEFGRSSLHFAALGNNTSAMRLFLEQGYDIETLNEFGETALNYIAENSVLAHTFKLLIESGANVDAVDKENHTPLYKAAFANKYDNVKMLLEAGANFRVCDSNGQSALHAASNKNNLSIVKLLLKNGSDPNMLDSDDESPLHLAAHQCGKLPVVELLVESGCNFWNVNKYGKTALDYAIKRDKRQIVNYLKKKMNKNTDEVFTLKLQL